MHEFSFDIREADSEAIFRQFKEQVKANIYRLDLRPGDKLPDLTTLAAAAGISHRTAYLGLNELLRENICVRRPKKGTFVADETPSTRLKRVCGVYLKHGLSEYERDLLHSQIIAGIRNRTSSTGIDLVYLHDDIADALSFYVKSRQIDFLGLIMPEFDKYTRGARLAQLYPSLPIVYVNNYTAEREMLPPNIYCVRNDDYSGGFQAGELLLRRRHEVILTISLDNGIDVYPNRIQGFMDAVETFAKGRKPTVINHVIHMTDAMRREGWSGRTAWGSQAVRKVFAESPAPPTAIFSVNDLWAEGAHQYVQTHPAAGPVEIIGYDHLWPLVRNEMHFSTLKVDFVHMGERAVDLLGGKRYARDVVIQPQLLLIPSAFGGTPSAGLPDRDASRLRPTRKRTGAARNSACPVPS